jgi:tetratricopeptide (TPR) repeat protein
MRFHRFTLWSRIAAAVLPLLALATPALAQIADDDDADATPVSAANAHLPAQELSPKLLYQLLLAEIAGQRERLNLSVTTYLELARTTQDPRISQRATEVALFARNPKAALEAARLWAAQDPESDRARQTLSGLLVGEGKLSEAQPYLEQMLSKAGAQTGPLFMNLHSLLARHGDKTAVLQLVEALAKPYASLPEASYARSLAALDAGKTERASEAARLADQQRPGWESAALLQGQILQVAKDSKGLRSFYHDFLERYPKAQEVRLVYARLLVDDKEFPAARAQFQAILKGAPDNPDLTLAVGLLSMQLQDYAAAESYLQKVLTLGYREPDTVRFYLGQIHEEQKDWPGAAQWYGAVESGDQFVPARMRIAVMLSRQNRLQEGRDLLHSLPAETAEQKTLLAQADAQLLSDAHDYKGAWDALTDGLSRVPESADLLYDRAMVAEKLDRLDLLEADLRKVIVLKPDHAHAYNALGYTLADRTERYKEALELIQKAVSLAPGDPFIIDSLGWVQYRLGELNDAARTLKDAYARQADPEIAAHLGQVLWAQGQKDEATRLWQTSFKAYPDNEVLRATLEHHVR